MGFLDNMFTSGTQSQAYGGSTPIGDMGSMAEWNSFGDGAFNDIGNQSFNDSIGNFNGQGGDMDSLGLWGKDGMMSNIGSLIGAGSSAFGAYNAYNKNKLLEKSVNHNIMSGNRDYASRAQGYNTRRMDQLQDAGKSQDYIDANYKPLATS